MRRHRTILLTLGIIVCGSFSSIAQESISYDSTHALYHVYHSDVTDTSQDTLVHGVVLIGAAGNPTLSASVAGGSVAGSFKYSYELSNESGGVSSRGIVDLSVQASSDIDSITGPITGHWYAGYSDARELVYWTEFGLSNSGVFPDSSLSGFSFESLLPPTIVSSYASVDHGFYFEWGEGPTTEIALTIDSLERNTRTDTLVTIGPLDVPQPFNLGDFIDTLATYPSRASDLGWIDSASVANQLQISLDELSDDLAAGDSAHAAGLIERTLAYVESQKDSTLSSEAYALFRYNLEYAKNYLPDVFTLKLFTEGGYLTSSGQMKTTINAAIPQADTVFDDPGRWDYQTGKTFSDIPAHSVDWAYVAVWDNDLGSKEYESTGLVDKYGLLSLPVDTTLTGSYYLIVDHRNHVPMASDTLVDFTNGHAEYDFTTGHAYGVNPQAILETSPDTVYGMWTGDGLVDGLVTAPDFNVWLTETKAVASGYVKSDYNMDTQSTASDFNLWLANTKKVVTAPGLVREVLYGTLEHTPWTGEASASAPKTESTVSHRMRYHVTGNAQHEPLGFALVPLEVRTNSASIDTLGNATFDVYFNKDQMYYNVPQQYQELLDAGYFIEIHEGENEHGPFMRVDIGTAQPDTTRYLLDSTWDMLLRIGFKEEDGTITDHGVAANRGTADLGLLSNGVLTEPDSVAIWYGDAFQY